MIMVRGVRNPPKDQSGNPQDQTGSKGDGRAGDRDLDQPLVDEVDANKTHNESGSWREEDQEEQLGQFTNMPENIDVDTFVRCITDNREKILELLNVVPNPPQ